MLLVCKRFCSRLVRRCNIGALARKKSRIAKNASMMRTEIWAAASPLMTVASIEAPRSVKAYGSLRVPPQLDVAFCDFKLASEFDVAFCDFKIFTSSSKPICQLCGCLHLQGLQRGCSFTTCPGGVLPLEENYC